MRKRPVHRSSAAKRLPKQPLAQSLSRPQDQAAQQAPSEHPILTLQWQVEMPRSRASLPRSAEMELIGHIQCKRKTPAKTITFAEDEVPTITAASPHQRIPIINDFFKYLCRSYPRLQCNSTPLFPPSE
jgi:hypothetical protein